MTKDEIIKDIKDKLPYLYEADFTEVMTNPTKNNTDFPFWRNGMTYEEYEIERYYYCHNLDKYRKGEYKPLWAQ